MANQLKMATIDSIQTLHQRGWSMRRIARVLGIPRDTVARHLRQANQAGAPTGAPHLPGNYERGQLCRPRTQLIPVPGEFQYRDRGGGELVSHPVKGIGHRAVAAC